MTNREWKESLEPQIEDHLRLAVATFQNLDEARLSRPSVSGGWSIAQCLWHLNSYGHYYLPIIKSAVESAKEVPVQTNFHSGWLGAYFTKMMRPSAKTKKMKAFKDHVPPADLNVHAEVAEFIRQQELLLRLLRKAEHVDLGRIRIPISIGKVIRLKLGDVFQFMVAHDERHLQQASRNL